MGLSFWIGVGIAVVLTLPIVVPLRYWLDQVAAMGVQSVAKEDKGEPASVDRDIDATGDTGAYDKPDNEEQAGGEPHTVAKFGRCGGGEFPG